MGEQNDGSSEIKPFAEEHIIGKKGAAIVLIWAFALVLIVVIAKRGGILR